MIDLAFSLPDPSYAALAALFVASAVVYLVGVERGAFRHHDAPPLVPGMPLVGCFYSFWNDPLKFMTEARERYGTCLCM